MKILPDGAFPIRTPDLQFSRCDAMLGSGCFKWLITLTTKVLSHSCQVLQLMSLCRVYKAILPGRRLKLNFFGNRGTICVPALSNIRIRNPLEGQVMLLRDARDYQILFLSLFLVLGIGTRDWTIRIDLILVLIVTCCVTQWVATSLWNYFQQNPLITLPFTSNLLGLQIAPRAEEERGTIDNAETKGFEMIRFIKPENWQQKLSSTLKLSNIKLSFRSAVITSLGLSLLLRSDHYSTMILAGTLAILSKFIFQFRHKHFFNPANFGIISALILTKDAWVSPGQWGDDWWYALVFLGTGGMVLKRVGRWDTTAAFLGTYAGMEAIRNIWLGWTWDVFLHRLMSGSLLLFALFMITDPRSIPNAKIGRLLWAMCIAVFTFILRNQFFISTAVFWALFALSPLTIIFDNIWSAPRFSWAMVSGQLSVVGGKEPLVEDGVQG